MTRQEKEVKLWLEEYREIRQRIKLLKEMAKQHRSDPLDASQEDGEKQLQGNKRDARSLSVSRYDAEIRSLLQELEKRELLVGRLRGEAFQLFARYYLVGSPVTWERLADEKKCSVRHVHDVRARGLQTLAAISYRENMFADLHLSA